MAYDSNFVRRPGIVGVYGLEQTEHSPRHHVLDVERVDGASVHPAGHVSHEGRVVDHQPVPQGLELALGDRYAPNLRAATSRARPAPPRSGPRDARARAGSRPRPTNVCAAGAARHVTLELQHGERRQEVAHRDPAPLGDGVHVRGPETDTYVARPSPSRAALRARRRRPGFARKASDGSVWPPTDATNSSISHNTPAPSARRRLDPRHSGTAMAPGTAHTSRPDSAAWRAVMRAPLFSAASTTTTASHRPAMIRFRAGNLHGNGASSRKYSETSAPALPHPLEEPSGSRSGRRR